MTAFLAGCHSGKKNEGFKRGLDPEGEGFRRKMLTTRTPGQKARLCSIVKNRIKNM